MLGQGGVGTVWRARDLQLDRDVAVKQLQSGVASDPMAADRFRREATTAASLSHPSLVTIYDVGEDGDVVYLVMELVDGPSTRDVLAAGGPLEPGEVAALATRSPGRWSPSTTAGWCTATSSPATCCCRSTARPSWSTSAPCTCWARRPPR